MVRIPFNLSGGHLPTEHTTPSLAPQQILREVRDVFRKYAMPHIASEFITIHVGKYQTWSQGDVENPQNNIKLLWKNGSSSNATLDAVRTKLDKMRVLSDVCVASVLSFIPTLLSYLVQADLLGGAQYRVIDVIATEHGQPSIFDTSAGTNVVSKRELGAFSHAITNYADWVEDVQPLSSFMKDGWFQAALVTPPMLELAKERTNPSHKYDRYVSRLDLCFNVEYGLRTLTLVVVLGGNSQLC